MRESQQCRETIVHDDHDRLIELDEHDLASAVVKDSLAADRLKGLGEKSMSANEELTSNAVRQSRTGEVGMYEI